MAHYPKLTNFTGTTGGGGGSSLYETGLGTCSTQRCGVGLNAGGDYSIIGGGSGNTSVVCYSTIGGGQNNIIDGLPNTIVNQYNLIYTGGTLSGYYLGPYSPTSSGTGCGSGSSFYFDFNSGNLVDVDVIQTGCNYVNGDTLYFNGDIFPGGTFPNDNVSFNITTSSCGTHSTISGGYKNTTCQSISFIGGGCCNTIKESFDATNSSIISGTKNKIVGTTNAFGYNTILNGVENLMEGALYSTIINGRCNTTCGTHSTISGGVCNTMAGSSSLIAGGGSNKLYEVSNTSIIGGSNNSIIGTRYSTISGGYKNTIFGNFLQQCCNSAILGGDRNTILSSYSIIGMGSGNTTNNQFSGILGGCNNKVINDRSFIIGNGITTTASNTTHLNCLNLKDIPVDPGLGTLPSGTVYRTTASGNALYICI